MINVRKNFHKPPAILSSDRCNKRIEQVLAEKNKHKLCEKCCGEEVRAALKNLYHGKCAYCESDVEAAATLQIEHYRPRNRVKGAKTHNGYYWLGYEWSNLLPSCPECNKVKLNHFPIENKGKRVMHPVFLNGKLSKQECMATSKTLSGEKPLLLHPEVDEPEKHLIFLPDGRVKGLTNRGKRTIEICKLNRKGLIGKRKAIIDKFLIEIQRLLLSLIEKRNYENAFFELFECLLIDMITSKDRRQPYSRLAWFMFKKFNQFFIKPLDKKQQKFVRKAYGAFRKKYL
jgi:uncharacterized protein (TIGR02646 family)